MRYLLALVLLLPAAAHAQSVNIDLGAAGEAGATGRLVQITEDSERALGALKRFGSVTVLNGHIHQVMQKVEGNVTFHTARSTAFPQPAPGSAPSAGPMKVPDDKLRTVLGTASVTVKQGEQRLAIIDTPLQG